MMRFLGTSVLLWHVHLFANRHLEQAQRAAL